MIDESWEECIENNHCSKVSIDKARAKSLIETSEARIDFIKGITLKEENINFIFEVYYASGLEVLHAFVLLNGFKVDNHICLGYYLRDVINRDDLFRMFDSCRSKRNSLVYYGKKSNFEAVKENIEKIKKLIKELKIIIK